MKSNLVNLTTVEARDRAFQISKNIYLKNQYQAHLLEQKIAEVPNRIFEKSDNGEKREADLENPEFDNFIFLYRNIVRILVSDAQRDSVTLLVCLN